MTQPFPYIPARSTSVLLQSFDPSVYKGTPDTFLYRYLDAMAGTHGAAGNLVNQIMVANMSAAIDTCYFNELDYIVGNINFLARTSAESYTYDPSVDVLTTDQWDEVRTKDAWFRARIKDFFAACQLGGTPEGIRKCVSAAVASDCTIQEVWRYVDNFLYAESLVGGGHLSFGRTEAVPSQDPSGNYAATNLRTGHQVIFSAESDAEYYRTHSANPSDWEIDVLRPRNEVVIAPHKSGLSPEEIRLLRDMLDRILPMETVVTVDVNGLSASVPVSVSGASADSTYYEVIKQVDPGPIVSQLPPPEFLPVDLLPSEQWLLTTPPSKIPWWKPHHSYVTGDVVKNAVNFYFCVGGTVSGSGGGTSAYFHGPTGTGVGIVDGTVVWNRYNNTEKPNGIFAAVLQTIAEGTNKREAPSAAFLQSAQYSYYYLAGGGSSSPVDSVVYQSLQSDGSFQDQSNYQVFQQNSVYGDWTSYQKADSPDNYPGGKFGRHPGISPALNPDGTPYSFPYPSQSSYVAAMITKIEAMGGIADNTQYRLPLSKTQTLVYTYLPDYAVANFPPTKESTVSSSITRQRPRSISSEVGNPNNFVR